MIDEFVKTIGMDERYSNFDDAIISSMKLVCDYDLNDDQINNISGRMSLTI